MKSKLKSQAGMGTFEAAAMMIVLTTLLMGGAVLSDYLYHIRVLSSFTADLMTDTDIKPLRLNNSSGGANIEVNTDGLAEYLSELVTKAEEAIIALSGNEALSSSAYMIEAAYAVISINPQTGASQGLEQAPFSDSANAGYLSIPADDLQRTDLGAEFQRLAEIKAGDGVMSLHALPTPMLGYGELHQGNRYIDKMVVVGMRSFLSLEGTFTGQMYSTIGGNPLVSHHRANILRGNFSE